MTMTTTTEKTFADLLHEADTVPGRINAAYGAFHNYSLGNMLLALGQCEAREIPLGPPATFMGWKEKGRFVRKGQKAIVLCMPVTVTRKDATTDPVTGEPADAHFTRFVYKPHWFVLAQTDGADAAAVTLPDWNGARAL